MKKIIKATVSIVMVLMFLILVDKNIYAVTEGNWEYGSYSSAGMYAGTPYAGTAIIKKYTGKEKNVTIPSTIGGKKVTTISSGVFKDNSNVTTVTIPEGVISFEGLVFNNCANLTTVNVPSTLKEITSAFYTKCPKLTNINLPEGLVKMVNGTYRSVQFVTYQAKYDYDAAREVLDATNAFRKKNNLPALEMNYELTEAAMKRAQELALHFDHTRPSGLNSGTILYNVASAENIFYCGGYTTGTSMVNAWISSDGHRKQMENAKYKSMGVGVVIVNKQTFAVQVFSFDSSSNKSMNNGTKEVVDDIMVSELYDCFYLEVLGLDRTLNLFEGDSTKASEVKLWNHPRTTNFSSVRSYVSIDLDDVIWKSSDESIVKVEKDGTITATGSGDATITAKVGSQEQTFNVSVKEMLDVLKIKTEDFTILEGETKKLEIINTTTTPNNELTFISSDEAILTVAYDGTVTAVSEGSATIIVSAREDKTATVNVTVKKPNVVFTKEVYTILVSETSEIEVEIASEDGVIWKTLDSDIATVENGVVSGKKAGTTQLIAESADGSVAICKVQIIDFVLGDVDGNGVVNGTDAAIVLDRYNNNNASAEEVRRGDIDGNGVLNGNDAALILDMYNRGQ